MSRELLRVCQAQRSVLLLLFKWEPKGLGSPQCASCLTFPSPRLILRLSQYGIQAPQIATTPWTWLPYRSVITLLVQLIPGCMLVPIGQVKIAR